MIHFSRAELRFLRELHRGTNTLTTLSRQLELSHSQCSQLTGMLVDKGLIEKHRKGRELKLSFSVHPFSETLKQMFSQKLRLEDILSGSGFPLLMVLSMKGKHFTQQEKVESFDLKSLVLLSGLSRATVYRTLARLVDAAAVKKHGTRYHLSSSMVLLRKFLDDYAAFLALARMRKLAKLADIAQAHLQLRFVSGPEFIFTTPAGFEPPSGWAGKQTALTAFKSSGLEFHTSKDYYHLTGSKRPLGPEDHLLDTLLLDPTSPRNVSYALLALKKDIHTLDMNYLLLLGEVFGVKELVVQMLRFLNGLDKTMGAGEAEMEKLLPEPVEFERLCDIYGVV